MPWSLTGPSLRGRSSPLLLTELRQEGRLQEQDRRAGTTKGPWLPSGCPCWNPGTPSSFLSYRAGRPPTPRLSTSLSHRGTDSKTRHPNLGTPAVGTPPAPTFPDGLVLYHGSLPANTTVQTSFCPRLATLGPLQGVTGTQDREPGPRPR